MFCPLLGTHESLMIKLPVLLFNTSYIRYLLGIICLVLFVVQSVAANEKASAQQLEALNKRIKTLEQSLNQVKGDRTEAVKKVKQSEKLIAQTARGIRENINTSKKLQKQLDKLRQEQRDLSRKQDQQKYYLEKQIRAAYAMGRQEYLKVLLNQQQPDQVSRVLRYYDYINRERSRHIDEYLAIAKQKSLVEKEIVQKDFTLQALRGRLEEKRDRLKDEQQNHQNLVAQLDIEIKGKGDELKQLSQDRARLEKLLKEVQAAIINIPAPKDTRPFRKMQHQLPWPLTGQNRVRHTYGSEQIRGKLKRNGMVLIANEGQDVKAIHSGRVVFADWLRGYGVLLILDHGGGYMSLYGYNQAVLKEPGDWIHAGEVIATAGSSGGQSSSGLYFEIRQKGEPLDPLVWLNKKRRG